LKALAEGACRPYDVGRTGINLGEAAAGLVLSGDRDLFKGTCAEYMGGAVTNDANHISGPSRTGEGLYRSIVRAMKEAGITSKDVAHVSAHGTGTSFNDEMESIALERAGLFDVAVNSLKGYLGHTLGAAGVIEILLGLESMKRGQLLPSLGYEEHGVSRHMNIIKAVRPFPSGIYLKTASGFGGGTQQRHSVLSCRESQLENKTKSEHTVLGNNHTYCRIRQQEVFVNGELFYQHIGDEPFLMGLYRHLGISYPKFFKMDEMSRLAFLGSEIMMVRADRHMYADDGIGLLFADRSGSLATDVHFQGTLEGGIPSPALFVYTLPNIGMGEVCIRHGMHGENNFLVMEKFDAALLLQFAWPMIEQSDAKAVLISWVETQGKDHDGFFIFVTETSNIDPSDLQQLYEAA
jgi:3-oxoacyl-[acyl-carrier-protein] synthase I